MLFVLKRCKIKDRLNATFELYRQTIRLIIYVILLIRLYLVVYREIEEVCFT